MIYMVPYMSGRRADAFEFHLRKGAAPRDSQAMRPADEASERWQRRARPRPRRHHGGRAAIHCVASGVFRYSRRAPELVWSTSRGFDHRARTVDVGRLARCRLRSPGSARRSSTR